MATISPKENVKEAAMKQLLHELDSGILSTENGNWISEEALRAYFMDRLNEKSGNV